MVEDDAQVNKLAVEALEERGYRVLSAPDGAAALRLLDERAAYRSAAHRRGAAGRHERTRNCPRRCGAGGPAIKVLYVTGYTRNAIIHHGRLDPDIDLLDQAVHRRRA